MIGIYEVLTVPKSIPLLQDYPVLLLMNKLVVAGRAEILDISKVEYSARTGTCRH